MVPDWGSSASVTTTFTTGSLCSDVFLNFRGEDTRNNFTAFLNLVLKGRGIDVFVDSKKLWTGVAIGPALHKAIEGSKIFIPVFSQNYARSKWCLMELVQIAQCYISKGQMVVPIFFHVKPSHVRNQTGSFIKAFQEHEKNSDPKIVESWKRALKVVGDLKGEFIDQHTDQAEIVDLVAKRVLNELVSSTQLAESKYLIGIDSRVNYISSLLNIGSNDVQIVGICGPKGIGKTTIAKAIYNRIFSSFNKYSFISDVREQSMQGMGMGLASLQKRLLKDVFQTDFDIGHFHRGKKLIEERLCKENVLLILDDVDSKEQIEALAGALSWFGQGSRVIITTRFKYILNVAKVDEKKIYYPQKLDHEESLQLFSLLVFSMDRPPQNYMQLSHDVVRHLRGVPSTIEDLATQLSNISCPERLKSAFQKLNTGRASISSLASLFDGNTMKRENTTHAEEHMFNENITTFTRVSKSLNSSIASISSHLSIFDGNTTKRENNVHAETEHMSYGNFTSPFTRVTKSIGKYLIPNGSIATVRVGKWFSIKSKIRAALSKFTRRCLNLNGSTATDKVSKRFKIAEIRAATKNFNASLVLGQGGFGIVYKGVIDGTLTAIKRSSPQSRQGQQEFETEIEVLLKLRHRNVVSLIGFCEEKNEKILVIEYMAKGSLGYHLFGTNLPLLTWKQRLEICMGAARGLHYLHTSTETGIIHRDVKTSNILLDENFVAKMADFGTSRSGPALGHTHVTADVVGTFGYLAPEYIQTGHLTLKADVYSFGVVLFEVLCARPAVNKKNNMILADWALQCQKQRSLEIIVDRRLGKNYCPKSLEKFREIAVKCLANEAKKRPTMGEVLWNLEDALQLHEAWLKSNTGKDSTITLFANNVEVGETEEPHNSYSEDDESSVESRS